MKKSIGFLIPLALVLINIIIKLLNFPVKTDFYSDAALRYRYARMFAENGKLPGLDKKILYPDGVSPLKLDHPTMDAAIGLSYRLIKVGDFLSYTRVFIIIFSSLTVAVFYFFARFLFKKNLHAWLLTFLYAVGPPAYWRVIGNYLREEFALPFLFLGCFLLFKALLDRKMKFWLIAGICLGIGLMTWHMSQFFYGIVVVALAGYAIFDREAKIRPLEIAFFFLPIIFASVLWPPLFYKHFFLSPQNFLAGGLILYLIITRKYGHRLVWSGFLVFFLLVGLFLARSIGYSDEYGHVFLTMAYKIWFLLQKPANPQLLPADVRLIWMGPFASPGIVTFIFALGVYPAFFVVLFVMDRWKKRQDFFWLVASLTLIFGGCYLLVNRLDIFLYFFLILAIGYLVHRLKKAWLLVFVLLGLVDLHKGFTFNGWYQRLLPYFQEEWDLRLGAYGNEWYQLLGWIDKNIPDNQAILTDIDIGAMMLEKTNNPILIEPIYENRVAKERAIFFLDAFYESEDSLFKLAEKYKFKHILYHKRYFLDHSTSSNRYLTLHMNFNPDWVSYRFQFFPDSLHHFHRVVQTTSYAFYSIDPSLKQDLKYSQFFDPKIYGITYGEEPEEKTIEAVERNYHKLLNLYNDAVRFVARSEFANALGTIKTIHSSVPRFERSRALEAYCYQNMRDYNRACSLYAIYLTENPADAAVATTAFSIMPEEQRIKLGKAIYRQNSKNDEILFVLKKVLNPAEFEEITK